MFFIINFVHLWVLSIFLSRMHLQQHLRLTFQPILKSSKLVRAFLWEDHHQFILFTKFQVPFFLSPVANMESSSTLAPDKIVSVVAPRAYSQQSRDTTPGDAGSNTRSTCHGSKILQSMKLSQYTPYTDNQEKETKPKSRTTPCSLIGYLCRSKTNFQCRRENPFAEDDDLDDDHNFFRGSEGQSSLYIHENDEVAGDFV